MAKMRISLRWLLFAIGIVGSAVGLYVRWHLGSQVTYITKTQYLRHAEVQAGWTRDGLGRRRFRYLVVFPLGNKSVSGGGNFVRPFPTNPLIQREGIDLQTSPFYFKGVAVQNSEDGRLWLYRTTNQTLVEIQPGVRHRITTDDFIRLDQSSLWRDILKPMADAESQAFLKQSIEGSLKHSKRP